MSPAALPVLARGHKGFMMTDNLSPERNSLILGIEEPDRPGLMAMAADPKDGDGTDGTDGDGTDGGDSDGTDGTDGDGTDGGAKSDGDGTDGTDGDGTDGSTH